MSSTRYEKAESHEVVVTQQPSTRIIQVTDATANPLMPRGNQRDWTSGVFSCCDDMGVCLLGTLCFPCYQCCIAADMGESCCVPCCVPGSLIAMRTQIRGRHNLQGSIMGDCLCYACCMPCAQCQLGREVKLIKTGKAQM